MKKTIIFICAWLTSLTLLAQSPMNMNRFNQAANNCQNINCVRSNIDTIDTQIVTLLGERLAYVRRAAEIESFDESLPPHGQNRDAVILLRVGQQAAALGYSPFIARSIFSAILSQANLYEANYIVP